MTPIPPAAAKAATSAPRLSLFRPAASPGSETHWAVNGWPLTVRAWTAEEWAALDEPPAGAQRAENGVWVAMGMD